MKEKDSSQQSLPENVEGQGKLPPNLKEGLEKRFKGVFGEGTEILEIKKVPDEPGLYNVTIRPGRIPESLSGGFGKGNFPKELRIRTSLDEGSENEEIT